MFLIAGLGNPGDRYHKSRHNAGFILVDELFSGFTRDKYAKALISQDVVEGHEVLVVKPETFMNNSGASLSYLKDKYEVSDGHILVIYDDIDLPLGDLRLSFDRGDGGHNGIKSIVAQLGTTAFLRLRIGIAPKGEDGKAVKPKGGFFTPASKAVANYVLKDFSASDLAVIKNLSPKVKAIIEDFVAHGREAAMNRHN